jgi:hypothetical protein
LHGVCDGDGLLVGGRLAVGEALGLCDGDAGLVLWGGGGAEVRRVPLTDVEVEVGDAGSDAVGDAAVEAEEEGAPPAGAAGAGLDVSGVMSPEVGAGGLWSSGVAGAPSPPDPPDRAATESIAAAPTTAIAPIP